MTIGNALDFLSAFFLSRCGRPSDTRWCNTSKEIYILNRCWSHRHPVMERHASFRAGSSVLTCFDISHTGHEYSVVELQNAKAVVLMVAGLASHFVFDSFLRILFRADVLHFSLCMCSL